MAFCRVKFCSLWLICPIRCFFIEFLFLLPLIFTWLMGSIWQWLLMFTFILYFWFALLFFWLACTVMWRRLFSPTVFPFILSSYPTPTSFTNLIIPWAPLIFTKASKISPSSPFIFYYAFSTISTSNIITFSFTIKSLVFCAYFYLITNRTHSFVSFSAYAATIFF